MTAAAATELRIALAEVAKRSMGLVKACNNEESIKLYLVLPVLRALGYDSGDPLEVYPNHETDPVMSPAGAKIYTADFAILRAGEPVIAIGAGRTAADLALKRQSIGTYFSAWPSAKLGIVANGVVFEFYVDSLEPGTMDLEPFLSLDLQTIADNGVPDDVIETLVHATKPLLDPDKIAERAHLQLVRKRLRMAFVEEVQKPSDDLCRAMMGRVGFPGVRREAIERHYGAIVKAAFEEALVLPVVQRLKAGGVGDGVASGIKMDVSQSLASAEHEIALIAALRRRLAYLCDDDAQYQAIDGLRVQAAVGRLVIYLEQDPEGRIVEIIRGAGASDKFVFADTDIVTANLADIDAALKAAFVAKLAALEPVASRARKAG
jgi:predicted type IV restriction endonuclease